MHDTGILSVSCDLFRESLIYLHYRKRIRMWNNMVTYKYLKDVPENS